MQASSHDKYMTPLKPQLPSSSEREAQTKHDLTGNATLDIANSHRGVNRGKQTLSSSISLYSDSRIGENFHKNCKRVENEEVKVDRKLGNSATVSIDSVDWSSQSKGKDCYSGKSQKHLSSGDASNIYGAVGKPNAISFLGSWALETCKKEGIMATSENVTRPLNEGNERSLPRTGENIRINSRKPPEPSPWRWYFEAGTLVEIRASHLIKIICVLIVVIAFVTFVFHTRIRSLEYQKSTLVNELAHMRMYLDRAIERMEAIESQSIPSRSERKYLDRDQTEEQEVSGRSERHLVKREATSSRTTKELQYSSATISYNNHLNNGSVAPFDSPLDWTTGESVSPKKSVKEARAAYLEIDGTSVNIRKSRQLIGPWYMPESGNDIEFNGMWYNKLAVDSNGTAIKFQEDGLFLIYAQIFYQLQHVHNSKPTPMGYRIHLRKGNVGNNRRTRTKTIAECVPSFPSTFYQTCFTQVAWYVEKNDEVYLEHFTDSLPMIEAVKDGQTFLGIVRLNN